MASGCRLSHGPDGQVPQWILARGRTLRPPGWDRWLAFATTAGGGGKYYDYALSEDGKRVSFGRRPQDHSTDVLAQRAVEFICESEGPLFLIYAPYAPHGVAIPAPRHRDEFHDLELEAPPSYDEQDVSDKPRWVRGLPRLGPYKTNPNHFQALLGVDEAVARIVGALRDSGRLHNTLIVFASDNGYMAGEHRHTFKLAPYEESIRVPFVVLASFPHWGSTVGEQAGQRHLRIRARSAPGPVAGAAKY